MCEPHEDPEVQRSCSRDHSTQSRGFDAIADCTFKLGRLLPVSPADIILRRPRQVESSPPADLPLAAMRNPRTRIRNLLNLGVPKVEALTHCHSSKGPWVMSSSKAVHMALSLDYLKRLGVVSLFEIWTKLASKGRTA